MIASMRDPALLRAWYSACDMLGEDAERLCDLLGDEVFRRGLVP